MKFDNIAEIVQNILILISTGKCKTTALNETSLVV